MMWEEEEEKKEEEEKGNRLVHGGGFDMCGWEEAVSERKHEVEKKWREKIILNNNNQVLS